LSDITENQETKSDHYSQPRSHNLKRVGSQLGQSALDSGSGECFGQQVVPKRREFGLGVGDGTLCQQHAHLVQVEQRPPRFGRVHHESFLDSVSRSNGKQIALISVTGILAVDQVPCTEEIDDVRPAHIAVEVAQLVEAEKTLAYVLDGGDKLVHRVRLALHANGDQADPHLVVVERAEYWIDVGVL